MRCEGSMPDAGGPAPEQVKQTRYGAGKGSRSWFVCCQRASSALFKWMVVELASGGSNMDQFSSH